MIWNKILTRIYGPKCPCCERRSKSIESRRRNTRYVDDDLNFITSCDDCFREDDRYWKEQWDDYWSSVL